METFSIHLQFDITITKDFVVRATDVESAKREMWRRFNKWNPKQLEPFRNGASPAEISAIIDEAGNFVDHNHEL